MCNCNRKRRCNCNCTAYQNSNCRMNSCRCNNIRNHCNSGIYADICNENDSTPVFPENYLYGHAYTPNQTMKNIFVPEIGLNNGTIFPELVSPYSPGQSMDFINYLKEGGVHCE